jgi:hypothetical protein
MTKFARVLALAGILYIASLSLSSAQESVTSPMEQFGHQIGDDYKLINYTQFEAYIKKLESESQRVKLVAMGPTAEGRTQWMTIITSPENHANLDHYKSISARLAHAEGINEETARALAEEGKAVMWIDGGLHATETLGAHQLTRTIHMLASSTDAETMRFLDDVIILLVHANPDGMELVSDWYMRKRDPEERGYDDIPRLYQKYIGHDNNRDSYMVNQPETENLNRIMFQEWFPQMMYNHHQTGPAGIIVFVPPFRDPPNLNYDPLVTLGNHALGLAMNLRLVAEGKPGSGSRAYANYSAYFNGNIRTIGYFHNQIGMLTEMKGHPTPMELAFYPSNQLAMNDFAMPHIPGEWHFADAIDYSLTLNRAVLDYASRNRTTILFNRWRMGMNAIEAGNKDSWIVRPRMVEDLESKIREAGGEDAAMIEHTFRRRGEGVSKDYLAMLRTPENRNPRGYILPSDQKDFPTAVKFLNTLVKNGITIHQATADFTVEGKTYPAGSFVVKSAQAFRAHVLDMFEPQDHPDEFLYEGGPPIPPYDSAGYTLAFQMGVEFDRILEGFDGPFKKVTGFAKPMPGKVRFMVGASGYLLDHGINDSVIAVNRLLAAGHDVYWLDESIEANGGRYPVGTIYVPDSDNVGADLSAMAASLGISVDGISIRPNSAARKLAPVRVGLWDRYGGSMPSGWTRWLFEEFEFPYERVFPQELDDGGLDDKFDALVFVTDSIPAEDVDPEGRDVQPEASDVPREYRDHLGRVTNENTVPQLADYLRDGNTVMTIGTSTILAENLGLPVTNHLVNGAGVPLGPEEFFAPGSILQIRVDTSNPLAYGLNERTDISFQRTSPVLRLRPDADKAGVTQIGWFDDDDALRSGWAWGQDKLFGGTAIASAKVGDGDLHMLAPEILFRGQAHGTFQLLFNGIYLANATQVQLGEQN